MYSLLGTPTPQLPSCGTALATNTLSPGTLNELGSMLQSPQQPGPASARLVTPGVMAAPSPASGSAKRRRDGEGGGRPTRSSPN